MEGDDGPALISVQKAGIAVLRVRGDEGVPPGRSA
ncbi:hypothetical protein SAMN05421539_106119 [Jannaschia seohaensis]|uniref:Uncharacterized protein n=1 Tax=Jannaschia seohaensis TaxID=475081 RepID=A0A2Y9AWC3_9RHOB|nr:hypothetical protein BCF38_106119 [Jannaschia seohaensis]SSA47628.1 hypothetical protein SAMN05421539_106119 [Jannaschia seohaensis]